MTVDDREYEHFIFAPNQASAEAVAADLRDMGFRVSPPMPPESRDSDQRWVVLAYEPLQQTWDRREGDEEADVFDVVCERHGALYDGGGTWL